MEPIESMESSGAGVPSELGRPAARPSREYRAAAAFLVGGLLTLLLLLLYQGVLPRTPPIRGLIYAGGIVLGMLAMLSAAWGLATSRRWAVAAMTPMLVIVVLAGAAELFWAITNGSISLPFNALLALWALRAPVRTRPESGPGAPRLGVMGALVVVTLLASASSPLTADLLLRPGGPLIASRDDLVPALTVTCDAAPGVAPTYVRVAYAWRWARREPWIAGTDTITLVWYAVREDDADGFKPDPVGPLGPGIAEANLFIGRSRGEVFSVDLAAQRFEPGEIRRSLSPSGAPAVLHGSVEFQASYLHAPADTNGPDSPAIWRVNTDARCEW